MSDYLVHMSLTILISDVMITLCVNYAQMDQKCLLEVNQMCIVIVDGDVWLVALCYENWEIHLECQNIFVYFLLLMSHSCLF